MGLYELSTTFQCPKCMSRITPIVFSKTKPDKETEIRIAYEKREKHMALHKKSESFETIKQSVEALRKLELFGKEENNDNEETN